MKVADLLKEIQNCEKYYGPEFLNWEVYIEVIQKSDLGYKKKGGQWKFIKDSENWEYIEGAGFNTKSEKEKIFTINANY